MSKVLGFLKREFFEVLPPTIFFFIAFHIIAVTNMLTLKQHGITVESFTTATIAALVVAKVLLVADHFPFVNKFPHKPLLHNTVWKTAIYLVAALLVRYAEHLIHFWSEAGSFAAGNEALFREVVWPHFWATQIWLTVLLFVYTAFRELVRAIGPHEVRVMFLGSGRSSRDQS